MSSLDSLAYTVSNFNPWWIVVSALIVLLIGWMTDALSVSLVIACSLISLAVFTGLGLHPKIILLLYPTTLFVFYFYQKKVFDKISSSESPYSDKIQSHKGQTGVFIIKESKNESESYFYDYKKNISVENEHTPPTFKTLRVILDSNGETHSAIDESGLLKNNDKVVVKNEVNGSLIVEKINN